MKPSTSPACSATSTWRAGRREPANAALEVARPGRIALVGQQGGDPLRVVGSAAGRIVSWVTSFMARWYPRRRAATHGPRRVDDHEMRPGNGPAGDEHRAARAARRAGRSAVTPRARAAAAQARRPAAGRR